VVVALAAGTVVYHVYGSRQSPPTQTIAAGDYTASWVVPPHPSETPWEKSQE